MASSDPSSIIVGSADGRNRYRLSADGDGPGYFVEEFPGPLFGCVKWDMPRSIISFATPAEAWLHVGKLLGWVEAVEGIDPAAVDQAIKEMKARYEAEKVTVSQGDHLLAAAAEVNKR